MSNSGKIHPAADEIQLCSVAPLWASDPCELARASAFRTGIRAAGRGRSLRAAAAVCRTERACGISSPDSSRVR